MHNFYVYGHIDICDRPIQTDYYIRKCYLLWQESLLSEHCFLQPESLWKYTQHFNLFHVHVRFSADVFNGLPASQTGNRVCNYVQLRSNVS